MKKKLLNILVIIFTIGVIYEVYSYTKEINVSNKVLKDIQLLDNLKDPKQIAIKLQKADFTWEEKGTSMTEWPDIETFEYYGSECVDANGNPITQSTNVINFNEQTQTVTINTSKTIYCTLSFARRSTVLKLMTKTTDGEHLKTYDGKTAEQLEQGEETEDELLRYVGTQSDVTNNKLNNFVCFGTENIDECRDNKDTYMYRIIGITTKNVNTNLGLLKDQLKIIKAVPNDDGKSIKWASDDIRVTWDSTSLNTEYLNDSFLQTITDITTKVGTHTWESLISNPKWYITKDLSVSSKEGSTTTLSNNYKIGLMYKSDYYNSWAYAKNTNSWLHITHGLSSSSSTYEETREWTMSGYFSGGYLAWFVETDGYLSWIINYELAVRPVFYLTPNISISGEGTESNPFIISDRIIE